METGERRSQFKINFSRDISIGNVFTAATVLCGLITGVANIKNDNNNQKEALQRLVETVHSMQAETATIRPAALANIQANTSANKIQDERLDNVSDALKQLREFLHDLQKQVADNAATTAKMHEEFMVAKAQLDRWSHK